ncbi:4Fe-4S dicluster domain-containing protein [Fibrella sp. HMF5335]|uniref:4Fe-4S dicluster domain-containing protein n=1 Tax=Fibrella rubiginis TaxID=2817060 RepID=A0A939GFF5_9BACT|nr:4Fe-4S dicluster domain-containing protein [Fibrella rubiginis]MBO0937999.1 4Fe-4S dicluster domain-containing protein [Fibrella rubiginis]
MGYFENIQSGIRTTLKGLSLTMRHLRQATRRRTPVGMSNDAYFDLQTGLVTLQYPHEQLPIPDNGRYRLHNEIDDCIVCDKCAKVCPVDCITIDPIKATEEIGKASDGSPIRLYAATFDIDMAKCCYCGLCTVVCPTECLTMEKTFDYSTYDLGNLTYAFANLTPEEADEKRALYEQFVREKEAAKIAAKPVATPAAATTAPARPAFRPGMKPTPKPAVVEPSEEAVSVEKTSPVTLEPIIAPAETPAVVAETPTDAAVPAPVVGDAPASETPAPAPKPRPVFRPGMKPAAKPATAPTSETENTGNSTEGHQLHPLTDPAPDEAEAIASVGVPEQPGVTEPLSAAEVAAPSEPVADPVVPPIAKPKPAFRPTMKPPTPKPVAESPPGNDIIEEPTPESPPKPKPAFRPTMKPKG